MKDLNKDAYRGTDKQPADIKLANRDQEILMGQDNDEDPPEAQSGSNKDTLQTIDKNEIVDINDSSQRDASILGNKAEGKFGTRNDKSDIKKDLSA